MAHKKDPDKRRRKEEQRSLKSKPAITAMQKFALIGSILAVIIAIALVFPLQFWKERETLYYQFDPNSPDLATGSAIMNKCIEVVSNVLDLESEINTFFSEDVAQNTSALKWEIQNFQSRLNSLTIQTRQYEEMQSNLDRNKGYIRPEMFIAGSLQLLGNLEEEIRQLFEINFHGILAYEAKRAKELAIKVDVVLENVLFLFDVEDNEKLVMHGIQLAMEDENKELQKHYPLENVVKEMVKVMEMLEEWEDAQEQDPPRSEDDTLELSDETWEKLATVIPHLMDREVKLVELRQKLEDHWSNRRREFFDMKTLLLLDSKNLEERLYRL